MADNPFVAPQASLSIDRKALVASLPRVASAARWFWWIAALSLINTILMHSGSQTTFVIGLGFTLVADAFFQAFKPAAFVVDAVALGFFFAMGFYALRGHRWAFIVGASFYALDALIYLYFGDLMPLAFHAWALFSIITGVIALNNALKAAQAAPALQSQPAPVVPPAQSQP